MILLSLLINLKGRAEAFNAHFFMCFNYSVPPLVCNSFLMQSQLFFCSEQKVGYLLLSVDINKATRPEGLSAKMQKSTAASIAATVTALLICLCFEAGCLKSGKRMNISLTALLSILSTLLESMCRVFYTHRQPCSRLLGASFNVLMRDVALSSSTIKMDANPRDTRRVMQ